MNKIFLIISISLLVLLLIGCTNGDDKTDIGKEILRNDKVNILTSFYPIEEITKNIVKGNDSFEVEVLIPVGIEVQSYDPSSENLVKFSNSDIFIKMGYLTEIIENKVLEFYPELKTFDSTKNINTINFKEEYEKHERNCNDNEGTFNEFDECLGINQNTCSKIGGKFNSCASACRNNPDAKICTMQCVMVCQFEHEEQNHIYKEVDPHIWLSIENMIIMTKNIEKELISIYPENKYLFEENAKNYIKKLEILKQNYKFNLNNCQKDTILVLHKAFGYLGNDWGFKQVSIAGFSAEIKPTPQMILDVINTAKKYDLNYIYTEKLIDSKISEIIANDIGTEVLELRSFKLNENETYIDIMNLNLNNLKIGLECE